MALNKTFAKLKDYSGSAVTTLTTDTFDSTGYDNIYVVAKHEGAPTALVCTDNKASVFTALTKVNHSNGDMSIQHFHGPIGTPGTVHSVTITFTATRTYSSIRVWLKNSSIGSTIELNVESTAQASSGTAGDAGTLTTTTDTVSFMCFGQYFAATGSPSSGWGEDFDGSPGYMYGASRGPEAAGTLDPAVTFSSGGPWAGVSASFKEPGGGGGGPTTLRKVPQRTKNYPKLLHH